MSRPAYIWVARTGQTRRYYWSLKSARAQVAQEFAAWCAEEAVDPDKVLPIEVAILAWTPMYEGDHQEWAMRGMKFTLQHELVEK